MSDFSKKLKQTAAVAVGLAIIAGAGGTWWYQSVYTATPEYALKQLEESVDKHDKEGFYKYVAIDHLLDSTSDAMLDGLVATTVPFGKENKEVLADFTNMFKVPVRQSLQNAVDNYVTNGRWEDANKEIGGSAVDADMIMVKAGLAQVEFRSAEVASVDKDAGTAVVRVKVYQSEADGEYDLNVELHQVDGVWQVYEITNFRQFMTFVSDARHQHMLAYMAQSDEIIAAHDKLIRDAERQIHLATSTGSLSDTGLRAELKSMVTEGMLLEWRRQKEELDQMEVPVAAQPLHKLRQKICDANISYAESYAKWLDTKAAADIKQSEESLRIARTLEQEADKMVRQTKQFMK